MNTEVVADQKFKTMADLTIDGPIIFFIYKEKH